jgi:hypothetical protein
VKRNFNILVLLKEFLHFIKLVGLKFKAELLVLILLFQKLLIEIFINIFIYVFTSMLLYFFIVYLMKEQQILNCVVAVSEIKVVRLM